MHKRPSFLLVLAAIVAGALVSLLSGCSPVLRVYSEDSEAAALVHAAGELLDVPTRMEAEPGPGVTVLEIRPSRWDAERGKQLCGEALEKALDASSVRDALTGGVVDCTPKAWSCATVTFVAHELGHVYGLPHKPQTEDKSTAGNVMQPAPGDSRQTTRRQRLVVRLHALGLAEACRPE